MMVSDKCWKIATVKLSQKAKNFHKSSYRNTKLGKYMNNTLLPERVPEITTIIKHILKDNVLSIYLFGSAVMGGLKPNSDLDFFVLVEQPLSDKVRQQLVTELMKVSGRKALHGPARPVELTIVKRLAVIPWRYPAEREFQYGEWLREEFEQGHWPKTFVDPDLAVLISKVRNNSLVLIGKPAHEAFDPVPIQDIHRGIEVSLPVLLNDLYGDERNVILTLARMWRTVSTGEIVSKDQAALWALERLPSEYRAVLDLARKAYLGECRDDWQPFKEQVNAFSLHVQQVIKDML